MRCKKSWGRPQVCRVQPQRMVLAKRRLWWIREMFYSRQLLLLPIQWMHWIMHDLDFDLWKLGLGSKVIRRRIKERRCFE